MSSGEAQIKKHTPDAQTKIRSAIAIKSFHQCVEELVQNALDSASSCVAVRINVGTGFVSIVDNGTGISYKSMRILGKRYASSKSLPTRKGSSSHGYRGEALASVAVLCEKMEVISKCDEEDTLCKTFANGKTSLKWSEEARPSKGTTVIVSGLFHRSTQKHSTKSINQMTSDVVSKVESLAVVHCSQSSFILKDDRNGKVLVNTGRVKSIREVIAAIFGGDYCTKIRPVSGTHDQLQMEGVISCCAYNSSRLSIISLNKRILHRNKLHHTIEKELKHSHINLPEQPTTKYPGNNRVVKQHKHFLYVINIKCDPHIYDVMIDPDKAKVEFEAWQRVLDSVIKLIRRFLFVNNLNIGVENMLPQDAAVVSSADLCGSKLGSRPKADSVLLCQSDEELDELVALKKGTGKTSPTSRKRDRNINQLAEISDSRKSESTRKKSVEIIPSEIHIPPLSASLPDAGRHVDTNYYVAKWILQHFTTTAARESSRINWSLYVALDSSHYKDVVLELSSVGSQCEFNTLSTSPSEVLATFESKMVKKTSENQKPMKDGLMEVFPSTPQQACTDMSCWSPVKRKYTSKGCPMSAPQLYGRGLKRCLEDPDPIFSSALREPHGEEYQKNSHTKRRRVLSADAAIPSYATPIRKNHLGPLVNDRNGLCALSPSLQKIFAPLNM